MSILYQGGWFPGSNWSDNGITRRYLDDSPSSISEYVASSDMKNSHSYTDYHNVDEDVLTVSEQGGFWTSETGAGIAYLYINFSPNTASDGVASYV